jgi:hypothetical protein
MGTKSRESIHGSSIRASAERAAEVRKEADRLACEAWNYHVLGAIRVFAVFISVLLSATISSALGADQVHDEIQVYNAEIAAVGQWTYQQHLNYAAIGQTVP